MNLLIWGAECLLIFEMAASTAAADAARTCNDACAAADGPVRVLVLGALLRAARRPVEF